MERGLAVALAALLVLAGCTAPAKESPGQADAPAATADAPDDAGPPEGVVVRGGTLRFDANATHDRVQALLDGQFAGTVVTVRDLTSRTSADLGGVPFYRLFGVSNVSLDAERPGGLTRASGAVTISPANASAARVEQVLAHELVHVAQIRERMVPWFAGVAYDRAPLDERLAQRALVEGGAVYATDAYTRAHLPGVAPQSTQVARLYADGSSGERLVYGQYHFGYRYANATLSDASALPALYDDAVDTTERLLHPESSDSPVALDVTVDAETAQRVRSPTRRAGELATRILLRDVVPTERAVAASEGWGNDRVVLFEANGTESAAWVTRWDSAADADEFASAAGALAGNATSEYAYRTARVDDRTVVVFAGTEQFVADASASGNVTVAA